MSSHRGELFFVWFFVGFLLVLTDTVSVNVPELFFETKLLEISLREPSSNFFLPPFLLPEGLAKI